MAYSETHKLIELIILNIDCKIYIDSISQIGATNNYLIKTTNTKWIGLNRFYTIGTSLYKVIDINPNVSFTIEKGTQVVPIAESMLLPTPNFYHGTYNIIAGERIHIENSERKNDFIYFNEPSTDIPNTNELSAIDRVSTCDLFFMKEADFENWTNEKHYNYAVLAMGILMREFINACKNTFFVGELENYNSESHVKWGVVGSQGHTSVIFNEHLSGKLMNITIPFLKTECDFNAYTPPTTGGAIGLVINFNGVEYYNQIVSEDTTINIIPT